MLLHAPWGGRDTVEGAQVLDVFAGTGAFGLEALSRGAAHATFIEHDRAALAALRANIAACRAQDRSTVLAIDALAIPPGAAGEPGVPRSALPPRPGATRHRPAARRRPARAAGTARSPRPRATSRCLTASPLLAERRHGAARLSIWREA